MSKADAQKKASKMQEKANQAKTSLEGLQKQGATIKADRIAAEKCLEETKASIKRREELKAERDAVRSKRLELEAKKKTLSDALAKSRCAAEESTGLLGKNKEDFAKLEEEKVKVDELVSQKLASLTENKQLLDQIETAEDRLTSLKDNPEVQDLSKKVDQEKAKLEACKKEVQDLLDQLKEKESELAEIANMEEETKIATQEEFKKLMKDAKELESDTAAQQARLDKADAALRELDAAKAHKALYHKLLVLRQGVDMLKETAKKEKAICDLNSDEP